jgi:hypothetical protein
MITAEGALTGQRLECQDTERPEIAPRIDDAPASLLGAHVRRRTNDEPRRGRVRREARAGLFGDTEVEDLDDLVFPDLRDEHVARLEIAMDDSRTVREREAFGDLVHDHGELCNRQAADADQTIAETFTVEQLHDHVGRPFLDPEVEDLNDVWASQVRGGFRLALEPRPRGSRFSHARGDEFHGHGRVEQEVTRSPHRPHAARCERPVEAQLLSDDPTRRGLHRAQSSAIRTNVPRPRRGRASHS